MIDKYMYSFITIHRLSKMCCTKTYMHSIGSFLAGLRYLMRICSDLGLPEAQEYATKLKKAEKTKELREQVCIYCPLFMGVIVSKHYLNQGLC